MLGTVLLTPGYSRAISILSLRRLRNKVETLPTSLGFKSLIILFWTLVCQMLVFMVVNIHGVVIVRGYTEFGRDSIKCCLMRIVSLLPRILI